MKQGDTQDSQQNSGTDRRTRAQALGYKAMSPKHEGEAVDFAVVTVQAHVQRSGRIAQRVVQPIARACIES